MLPRLLRRGWSEAVRFGIPEGIEKPDSIENLSHFRGLRPAGVGLQARRVPRIGEHPELIHANQRTQREVLRRTPFARSLFRPEEEHFASSKNDVVPPMSGGHDTMKEPIRRLGPLASHLKTQRLRRLLAARINGCGLL